MIRLKIKGEIESPWRTPYSTAMHLVQMSFVIIDKQVVDLKRWKQVLDLKTFFGASPRVFTCFIIAASSNGKNDNYNNNNDNNKGPFLKYLASSRLKVIRRYCNTTQTLGFAGMFPEIISSAFILYFELKSNWWLHLSFSFWIMILTFAKYLWRYYNPRHNILAFLNNLAQVWITTSKTKLDI